MLIKEELESYSFSQAESLAVRYIINHVEELGKISIQALAKETFTQPSTIVRIAKKLGFKGWVDFKHAYLEEHRYLTSQFTKVNSNIPFTAKDNVMTLAAKIASLEKSTIDDLLSLLHYDDLSKAKLLLNTNKTIYIFGQNANILLAQDFALKMRRLGKLVRLVTTAGEEKYEAYNITQDSVAILISTSGETPMILDINEILAKRKIKRIVITSIGNNSLSQSVDLFLPITTREKLFSKIGNFTTNISIHVLLDILYGLVFSSFYDKSLNHLKKSGQLIDRRFSATQLMEKDIND